MQQVRRLCNVTPDYASEPASILGSLLAEITPGDLANLFSQLAALMVLRRR